MAEKEKGRKRGRVERHINHVNWTAWLARQIMMQVQKQNIDLDVIVQLNISSPAASSKRSSTDSATPILPHCAFSHFTAALPGARSAPQLATLRASSHGATSGSRSCLMPRRPFASVAQGRNNDYFNGRRLARESPRRSVILSTAPNVTLHVTPKFQPPADSTDRETRLVEL